MPYIQNNNAAKIQQSRDMCNVEILYFFKKVTICSFFNTFLPLSHDF